MRLVHEGLRDVLIIAKIDLPDGNLLLSWKLTMPVSQVVDSWVDKLEATEFKPLLTALFAKYVDPTLEHCRRNFKYVTPMPGVSQVMNVCKILEGILPRVSHLATCISSEDGALLSSLKPRVHH